MTMPLNFELKKLIEALANTHEKQKLVHLFDSFLDALVYYCENEKNVFRGYRILKQLEGELRYLNDDIRSSLHWIVEKLLFSIRSEEKIIEFQIRHPGVITLGNPIKEFQTSLIWTDDKIALVELIYAISKSLNNGGATIKSIAESFESMFQIELGSYYRILLDINNRKTNVTRYLDTLPSNLWSALDKLNH